LFKRHFAKGEIIHKCKGVMATTWQQDVNKTTQFSSLMNHW